MKIWTGAIPFFSESELKCKGSGELALDPRFAAALSFLRASWGKPLIPTSVCRSWAHNVEVGGHIRSLHLTDNPAHPTLGTCAADIAWRSWSRAERLAFARHAFKLGLSVGLHNGFCHVDYRTVIGLPQAVFLYGEWSGEFSLEDVRKTGGL